ncbi:MAG: M56 family metallopeptidase [Gemmatimonadota bacterium]|nr:M56 family metallopeptidase [Gemmatimonadota bacterium]
MVEISLFIVLVWVLDRWLTLETRFRYTLYLLALAKVFVPPVLAIPIPSFLDSPPGVAVEAAVYSGVVSDAVAVSPGPANPFPLAFYLFCVWILSVSVWTGVALWKNAAFRRTLRSANPVDLASEVPSLNAPRNLDVYSKADLPSPVLVGLTRPRLILPSKWSSWSPEELQGVVRHELAHFEKRDIHVLILQAIATALFGVNPLVWLLNRRLMLIRELRCDEAVLRETRLTPAEYGRLLLGFVDRRLAPRALTVFFSDRGTTLRKRLEHVLNFKEVDMKRSKRKLAALVLVGLAIVPFSIREAYTQDERGPQSSNSAVLDETASPAKPQTAESASGHVDSNEVVSVVYDIEEVDEKPHPLKIIGPEYPEEARSGKIEGDLLLKIIVNVDGSVSEVAVLKGPEIFHKAASDAVLQWRFRPAVHEGRVVPVSLSTPVRFSSEPDNVLEFWSVDVKPVLKNHVESVYPERARKAGEVGNVFLRFVVNVDGTTSHIKVVKGKAVFHEDAIIAISKFRFAPAQQDGEPVPVWMTHVIRFGRPKPKAMPPPDSSDADGEKVFDISSVDVKPIVIHSVPPVYPEWARFTGGDKGVVSLKFKVNVDGSVTDVRVGNGRSVFVKSAIDAISQFRFQPGERDGKPVPVWMTHRISFSPPKPMSTSSPGAGDAASENVFELRSVDAKPVVIHSVQPVYPDIAKEAGLAGDVALKFKVNVDGTVSDVDAFVLKGGEIFRKPAIVAVKQFLYRPAEHDGEAVAVRMTHHFAFAPSEHQDEASTDRSEIGNDKVFEFWDVDVKPVNVNLSTVRPVYPDHAKKAGLTGNVFLKFKINLDGSVSDAKVLKGDEVFRQPAIDAVSQFRFKPAEIGGKPVPVWMSQRIVFALPEHQEDAVPETGEPGVGN